MYLNVYSSESEYQLIENICGEGTILEHIQKLDGVKLVNIINKINNFGNRCDGSIFYLADTQDTDEELLGAFNYYRNYVAKKAIIILPNGRNSLKQRLFELRLTCVIFENEIDTKLKVLASDEYREIDSAYDIQMSIMEEIRSTLPNILKYPKGLTFNIGVCGAFWSGATTVYYSLANYLRGLGLPVCLIGENHNVGVDMDTAKSFVSGKVNLIELSEANLIDGLKEIHFLVLVSNADKYIGESYEDIPTSEYIVKVINFAKEKDCIPMDNVMYMPFLYSKKDEARANDYWSKLLEKRLSQIISDVDYISKDK